MDHIQLESEEDIIGLEAMEMLDQSPSRCVDPIDVFKFCRKVAIEKQNMRMACKATIRIAKLYIDYNDFTSALKQLRQLPKDVVVSREIFLKDSILKFLQLGHDHFSNKSYHDAGEVYRCILQVTREGSFCTEARIGEKLAQYQNSKKPLSWLRASLKEIQQSNHENASAAFETWLNYLIQSGESKQRTDDVKGSIIELDIANCIYEENIKDKSALLRNIKTGLARSYFKLGNCKQALKNLEDCSKLYDDFFVEFWNETEKELKRDSLGCPEILSTITQKMPKTEFWKKEILKAHLELYKKLRESKQCQKAVDQLEMINEYMTNHNFLDKDLAEAMKMEGSKLAREEQYGFAQQVYTFALNVRPRENNELYRNLLSNRSYVNVILKNYCEAVADANKCAKLFPNWPKSHFRLGKAYMGLKDSLNAHKALLKCYQQSESKCLEEVLHNILINKASSGCKIRWKIKLPTQISPDVINKCVSSLSNDPSKMACDALEMLVFNEEYESEINAASANMTNLILKGASSDLILSLLTKSGATVQEEPNVLQAFVKQSRQSKKDSQILMRLVEKKADVSEYICEPCENWQHSFLHLCIKLGNTDILSDVVNEMDLSVTDAKGNNALHMLAKMKTAESTLNCVKIIEDAGVVDPRLKNERGEKPKDLVENPVDEIYKVLADYEIRYRMIQENKKRKRRKKKKTITEAQIREDEMEATEPSADELLDEEVQHEAQAEVVPSFAKEEDLVLACHERTMADLIKNFTQTDYEMLSSGSTAEATDTQKEESVEDVEEAGEPVMQGDENARANNELDVDFDSMPWDVQCSPRFLKKLQNPRLSGQLKRTILSKVKLLSNGEWKAGLACKLPEKHGICLYKAELEKSAWMIWEKAVVFSERLSSSETEKSSKDHLIYTDVIRLWDFTQQPNEYQQILDRISLSCQRGQSSSVTNSLIAESIPKPIDQRLPQRYYDESKCDGPVASFRPEREKGTRRVTVFPPASPNDREHHILKFYALSSAMSKCLLDTSAGQVYDFPFQLTELEYQIINLTTNPTEAILLLGRSGTGKTTCCLYRLWSRFKAYWENTDPAAPRIPVSNTDPSKGEPAKRGDAVTAMEATSDAGDLVASGKPMNCGCRRHECTCALAVARANFEGAGAYDESSPDDMVDMDTEFHQMEAENSDESDESLGTNISESDDCRHLRQLFLTKNKVLCHEVKKTFKDFCNGLSAVQKHLAYESVAAIENLHEIKDSSHPLFLGSRELLLALDASLPGKRFFPRQSQGKLVPIAGWGEMENHLVSLPALDSDDEGEEVNIDNEDDEIDRAPEEKIPKASLRRSKVKREVTYTVFEHELWPEIEKNASSGYHPSLVWIEFCSFIKGSANAIASNGGYTPKEIYDSIGKKKAPNFSGDRSIVYAMFEDYRKICRRENLFDEFDVLSNIYRRLDAAPPQGWLFDEIFVDETQDFAEAELLLIIRCCRDPNMLFFTGDTAQSIMRGITFRFKDLKSLFFDENRAMKAQSCYKKEIEVPSQVHKLKHNYRSHKGILKLASKIIQLLGYFFPGSFDELHDDVGLFDGPKPVILKTNDFGELAMMLRGARRKTSPIEFGAHQVVLVSSEESKKDLPSELNCGLVLTIYEAKGLEFDDILLYNFFKDSQARKEWRVVTSYLETEACMDDFAKTSASSANHKIAVKGQPKVPFGCMPLQFNQNKHKILCSELKQLYTAITRARVNVWIFDQDQENRAPMFNFFEKLDLIDTLELGKSTEYSVGGRRVFTAESTAADWEKQGFYFYKKEFWTVAYKCFKKAPNKEMLNRCDAHMHAKKAYEMAMELRNGGSGSLNTVNKKYVDAAKLFLTCGMGEEAAICLKNGKEWKQAGELFAKFGKFQEAGRYFAKAASTLKNARDDSALKASECYEKCLNYRGATDVLYRNERYGECICMMKKFQEQWKTDERLIKPPRSTLSIEKIVMVAADNCIKRMDTTQLKEYLSELPTAKQLDYVRKKPGCKEVAIDILMRAGRNEEVAEIYFHEEEYLKAADCTKTMKTKGLCYLEQAQLLYNNKDGKTAISADDSVLHWVELAIPLLKEYPAGLADCYILKSRTTECLDYINDARTAFIISNNHIAVFFCDYQLWSNDRLCSDVIMGSLSKMLHHIGRTPNEMMKLLHTLLGIEKVVINNADEFFRINEPRFKFHLSWLNCEEIAAIRDHFQERNAKAGNACILRTIFALADEVIKKLVEIFETELQRNEICYNFLQGIHHENCPLRHYIPDAKAMQLRFNALFSTLQMQGMLRERKASILKDKYLNAEAMRFAAFTMYKNRDMTDTCHSFYLELTYSTRYLTKVNFTGVQLAKSLPEMNHVKGQIQWCINEMWKAAGEEGRLGDFNLFLKIFTLSVYAGIKLVQYEVDKMQEDIQKRYKFMKPPSSKLSVCSFPQGNYETLHSIFMRGKNLMHKSGNLVGSMHHLLRRVFPLVESKDVQPMTLANFLQLLEFSLYLCLVSLSNANIRSAVLVPEFYAEGAEFWSETYTSCFHGEFSAVNCAQKVPPNMKPLVKQLVNRILSFVKDCCTDEKNYDPYQMAFAETNSLMYDARQRATAERFLILLLVLMCNLPTYSEINISKLPICSKLQECAKNIGEFHGSLMKSIRSASQIRHLKDARRCLKEILERSNQKLIDLKQVALHHQEAPASKKHKKSKSNEMPPKEEKVAVPKELLKAKAGIAQPEEKQEMQVQLNRRSEEAMSKRGSAEIREEFDHLDSRHEDDKAGGMMQREENYKGETLSRGFSQEDEGLGIEDDEATLLADKERKFETQTAVNRIQIWWRKVLATRKQKGVCSEEDKLDEHLAKYANDLRCNPCGLYNSSIEALHEHIKKSKSHDEKVVQYEEYASYTRENVSPLSKSGEDLLDEKIFGQMLSEQGESEALAKAISNVKICMNSIEKRSCWTDLEELEVFRTQLEQAYIELKNIKSTWLEGNEVCTNDDDYVQLTTRKKLRKQRSRKTKNKKRR